MHRCSLVIQIVSVNEHQWVMVAEDELMIKTRGLTKSYTLPEVETTALSDINFEVQSGEFVAVMGPSGCGKSTLLHILGLLDAPTSGTYMLFDQEVSQYSERQRTELRKHRIGFVFQRFNLIDDLTVFENVELPLLYQGVRSSVRRQRVDVMLERMQMAARARYYPTQLSGGQQQRIAVARAAIAQPDLLLADEPTGNLDSIHGQDVMRLLTTLNEDGMTIVMVTHASDYAAYSHRSVYLFDGRVVSEQIMDRRARG